MRVLAWKRHPTKLPFHLGVTMILALDHWNAPTSTRSLIWGLYGFVFLCCLIMLFLEKQFDPWPAVE